MIVVFLITGSRDGRISPGVLRTVGLGLLRNPMIVSIGLGLAVSALALPIPAPVNDFLATLGAAATPGALFAIGASLASKSAERVAVAGWLSFAKLVLHPAAVAFAALVMLPVEPYAAGVMIAAAALPVAGNVFILDPALRRLRARWCRSRLGDSGNSDLRQACSDRVAESTSRWSADWDG